MNCETNECAFLSLLSALSKAKRWRMKVITEPIVSSLRW